MAGITKRCPGGEDGKETLYFIALGFRSPWAERPTSPGSAPAEDPSQCLKKNSGGTGRRGQLERWIIAQGEAGAPAVVLTHAGLCVLLPPRPGASWTDLGASFPPPPPPGSGGVACVRAGLSPSGCLTELTGLQIPPRCRCPPRASERQGGTRRVPGSRGVSVDFPAVSGLPPHPNLTRAAPAKLRFLASGIRTGGFSAVSELLASEPSPLFPASASQLRAKWTPKSEVKGIGTVGSDPSEAQLEGLASLSNRDWDPAVLPFPGGCDGPEPAPRGQSSSWKRR